MKIYNVSKKIDGLGNSDFDYEAVYNSGYSAGYKDGYDAVPCYKNMYFTCEPLEDGDFIIPSNTSYRVNGGEWIYTDNVSAATQISKNDTIEMKGVNQGGIFSDTPKQTVQYIVYGNVMSMIYGDDFTDKTTLSGDNEFYGAFSGEGGLIDASNLILPAKTVGESSYYQMFEFCGNLLYGPKTLPATTLGNYCYENMFLSCNKLVQAPVLPATVLKERCYAGMFRYCFSLVTAPELPATTLAEECYMGMFVDCTGLTTAPELPATTVKRDCYAEMFVGCTSLTKAPRILPAMVLVEGCYRNMFWGCSSLAEAPELPATTLADACYNVMFMRCASLAEAPELPATTLADACYGGMFAECTSLIKAPDLLAETLVTECYDSMFKGCTSLNYVRCLATDISAPYCTRAWLNNVAHRGTFVTLFETSWSTGDSGIPLGWLAIPEDI